MNEFFYRSIEEVIVPEKRLELLTFVLLLPEEVFLINPYIYIYLYTTYHTTYKCILLINYTL